MTALSGRAERSRFDDPSTGDLCFAGAILIGLVAFVPDLADWQLVLRAMVLWPIAGWGAVVLVLLTRRGDVAAMWAVALLAWLLVATVFSVRPWIAFDTGFANPGGWTMLAGLAAAWAIARTRGPAGRSLVMRALVVGLGANALLAVLQTFAGTANASSDLLRTFDNRMHGFAGNPVFLGALMAGGSVLAILAAIGKGTLWKWLPAVALFFGTIELSGSRIALVVAAAGLLVATVRLRPGWRRLGLVLVAVALGHAAAMGIASDPAVHGTTGRLSSGSGFETRTLMWEAGLDAALERPLSGWGPGQFHAATASRIEPAFVIAEGRDRYFGDAHNLVVELLVASGFVGLALAAGFVWTASKGASGPLAGFAAGTAACWAVEPLVIVTAVPVLVCLGASTAQRYDKDEGTSGVTMEGRGALAITVCLVLVGTAASLRLGLAAYDMDRARTQLSVASVRRASSLYPRDPVVADQEAIVLLRLEGVSGSPQLKSESIEAMGRTVDIDPTGPVGWYRIGVALPHVSPDGSDHVRAEAREALLEAHRLFPWSAMTLERLHELALMEGDEAEVERWADRLCQIDLCPDS